LQTLANKVETLTLTSFHSFGILAQYPSRTFSYSLSFSPQSKASELARQQAYLLCNVPTMSSDDEKDFAAAGGQHRENDDDDDDDGPSSEASDSGSEDEDDGDKVSAQLEQLEAAVAGNPNSYEAHFQVVFASPPLINSLSRSLPTPHMLFSLSLG
jgi:hypothetical protein